MPTYEDNTQVPIRIVKGDDWSSVRTIYNKVDGVKTPVDITGWTGLGVVRASREGTVLATMSFQLLDPTNGKFLFSLTDTQTSALPIGALYYQMSLTNSGSTQTYCAGNFYVR